MNINSFLNMHGIGQLPIKSASTITVTPGTTDQVFPSGEYVGGITVKGDTDLVASNIINNVSLFGITGTATGSVGTATSANVLTGKTFSNGVGTNLNGTMTDYSGANAKIYTPTNTIVNVDNGYHNGSTIAAVTAAVDSNIIASNIKNGVSILGVTGNAVIATGNAGTANVLNSKTFSIAGAANLTGTMTNYSGTTTGATASAITSITTDTVNHKSTTNFTSPITGYADNTTTLSIDLLNLEPLNIKNGVKVGSVSQYVTGSYGSDATAAASDILSGKIAYGTTGSITGTMSKFTKVYTPSNAVVNIDNGYHTGSTIASVVVDPTKVLTGTIIAGTSGTMIDNSSATLIEANTKISSILTDTVNHKSTIKYNPSTNGYITTGSMLGIDLLNLEPKNIATNIKIGSASQYIVGTYDSESTSPITANDVAYGKIGYVNGSKVIGTMTVNYLTKNYVPTNTTINIDNGTHSGSTISAVVVDPTKVLSGTTIAGTTGTLPNNQNFILMQEPNTQIDSVDPGVVRFGFSDIRKGYCDSSTTVAISIDNLNASNIATNVKVGYANGDTTQYITGTYDNESTSPITPNSVLSGKIGYVNGSKVTGTLASLTKVYSPSNTVVNIDNGIHSGSTIAAITVPASSVLVGTTIAGTAGTLPDKRSNTVNNELDTQISSVTNGNIQFKVSDANKGYYDGTSKVGINIDNFLSSNIATNVKVGYANGTPMQYIYGTYDKETVSPMTSAGLLNGKVGYVNGSKIIGSMIDSSSDIITETNAQISNVTADTVNHKSTVKYSPSGNRYIGTGTTLGIDILNLEPKNIATNVNIGSASQYITGTYDSESTSPITAANVLAGKIGFVNGSKITGTLASLTKVYTPSNTVVNIDNGIHSSSTIAAVVVDPTKVLSGTTIAGTAGTMTDGSTSTILEVNTKINNITTDTVNHISTIKYNPSFNRYTTTGTTLGIDILNLEPKNIASNVNIGSATQYITGTYGSDATVVASDMIKGKIGYGSTGMVLGTLNDNRGNTLANEASSQIISFGGGNVTFNPSMPAQAISNTTILGLSIDNLSPSNIANGIKLGYINGSSSQYITGTYGSDATAVSTDILNGKVGYNSLGKVIGNMANNGAYNQTINTQGGSVTIPAGYHNGSGKITANLTATSGQVLTPSSSALAIPAGYYDGTTASGKVAAVVVPVTSVLIGTTIAGVPGTMPNNGAVGGTISNQGGTITIPAGYTTGGVITANFGANLIAGNIKAGVNIGGIIGTYTGGTTSV